jgi:hypothetical protein
MSHCNTYAMGENMTKYKTMAFPVEFVAELEALVKDQRLGFSSPAELMKYATRRYIEFVKEQNRHMLTPVPGMVVVTNPPRTDTPAPPDDDEDIATAADWEAGPEVSPPVPRVPFRPVMPKPLTVRGTGAREIGEAQRSGA